jgi:ATP-binding cassette subfamily B protein
LVEGRASGMGGRTVIAIAHRLSSLRNFDRFVVLQAGRVCEDGPPQVLVQSKGVYCNLVRQEVARLEPRGQGAPDAPILS